MKSEHSVVLYLIAQFKCVNNIIAIHVFLCFPALNSLSEDS